MPQRGRVGPASAHLNEPHRGQQAAADYKFPEVLQRVCDYDAGSRENPHETRPSTTKSDLRHWLASTCTEIIVVLEGIDPLTSATLQARHSYSVDDIIFDHWFAPCVSAADDGTAEIDFSKFHKLDPVTNGSPVVPAAHL